MMFAIRIHSLSICRATIFGAVLSGICLSFAIPGRPVWGDDRPIQLYIGNADGSQMKPLVNLPKYTSHGSPAFSANGRYIAFDAWNRETEKGQQAKLIVYDTETQKTQILISGAMPSFSPKGGRIAFSSYGLDCDRGVWIVSRNGVETELVQIDERGWGIDWSPLGNRLVYATYVGNGANFIVLDIVEGTTFPMFDAEDSPFRSLYWNYTWSPDGTQIAFRARTTKNKEFIGVANVSDSDSEYTICREGGTGSAVIWRPGGKQIQYSIVNPETKVVEPFMMTPGEDDSEQLLSGVMPGWSYYDCAISPDGSQLVAAMRPPVEDE